MKLSDIIMEATLSAKQAEVLAALQAGAEIMREKSPPYRWENASHPQRAQIPSSTIAGLLRLGKVKMERIEARFLSHRLVLA